MQNVWGDLGEKVLQRMVHIFCKILTMFFCQFEGPSELKTPRPAPTLSSVIRHRLVHSYSGNSMKRRATRRPDVESDDDWCPSFKKPKRKNKSKFTGAIFGKKTPASETLLTHVVSPPARTRFRLTNSQKMNILDHFDLVMESESPRLSILETFERISPEHPSLCQATLKHFLQDRAKIIQSTAQATHRQSKSRVSVKRLARYRTGKYDHAEHLLHALFLERYHDGRICSSLWFRATMRGLVLSLDGSLDQNFTLSDNWRNKFFIRFHISFRAVTRQQALPLKERMHLIVAFFEKFKNACIPSHSDCATIYGKFTLDKRHHADQVPLEFQNTLDRTAAPTGAVSVHVRKPRFKLNHRVASLNLIFSAATDSNPLPGAICFPLMPEKNKETGVVDPRWPSGKETRKQFAKWKTAYPHIYIYAQKSGWFDDVTCLAWLEDILDDFTLGNPHILVMDNLSGHCTPEFRATAWDSTPRVHIMYTPADCTDACAVTDDGLGKAIKGRMRKMFLDHFNANTSMWQDTDGQHLTAMDRRDLYVSCFDQAMKDFYGCDSAGKSGQETVLNAFKRCGMAGAYDGSEDNLISVKGWTDPIVLQ